MNEETEKKRREAEERFKTMSLGILRKQKAGMEEREKTIFDARMRINTGLAESSKAVERATTQITQKANEWFDRVREHYVKDDTTPFNEILNSDEDIGGRIRALEEDLLVVSEGFQKSVAPAGDGYVSKIVEIKGREEQLEQDLTKQKELADGEVEKRKDTEHALEEAIGKARDAEKEKREAERELAEMEPRVERLSKAVEEEKGDVKQLRNMIHAMFGSGFHTYLLKQLSGFGIPGIDTTWEDSGIDYILSANLYELGEKEEFHALIKADISDKDSKGGKVELKDIRVRESYNELIKGLSSYAVSQEHSKNLRSLITRVVAARQELGKRASKELFWCGDYSKHCAFICPGFTSNEVYCDVKKQTPYNSERDVLLSGVLNEIYLNFEIAQGIESRIIRSKRKKP